MNMFLGIDLLMAVDLITYLCCEQVEIDILNFKVHSHTLLIDFIKCQLLYCFRFSDKNFNIGYYVQTFQLGSFTLVMLIDNIDLCHFILFHFQFQ